jgi:hypothetical protein
MRAARPEVGSAMAIRDGVRDVGWTSIWEDTWRDPGMAVDCWRGTMSRLPRSSR